MRLTIAVLLGTLLLAACGHDNDGKSLAQQPRADIDKAKQVDNMIQQQAQQQKQEADKQTQ
jgi:hypothetical protein